jgi:hypothetical protein
MKVTGKIISSILAMGGLFLMFATPALGLWLASSLVSAHGGPRGLALLGGFFVSARLESDTAPRDCGIDNGATVRLRCELPGPGRYWARLYTNRERTGMFTSIAAIDVTSR